MITTPQAFLVRRSVRLGARLGRRVVVGRIRGRLVPAPAPSPWRRRAPVLLALAGGTIVVARLAQDRRSGGVAPVAGPPAPAPASGAPAPAGAAPPVDDAALAASVRGVVDPDDVEVHVDRGVVTLSGRVMGLARVAALVQQTERVAGVRAVRSELRDATPDPRS